jgi:hypothetical protein
MKEPKLEQFPHKQKRTKKIGMQKRKQKRSKENQKKANESQGKTKENQIYSWKRSVA